MHDLLSVLPFVLPCLSMRDAVTVRALSRGFEGAVLHCAEHLSVVKSQLNSNGPCIRVFSHFGPGLLSLSLHRVSFADKSSLAAVLSLCPNLRKLSIHDCDWTQWDDELAAQAICSLRDLQELRLQCNDLAADRNPFAVVVQELRQLHTLRKLTLFSRTDPATVGRLAMWLADGQQSHRLTKLKLSTALLSSSNGLEILHAVARHPSLSKLTLVRPDGMGEPLKKVHCTLIGQAMFHNTNLRAIHLRRCGMWTDTLAALIPPGTCTHVERLKLDGNSLGYLSGSYFTESMDTLLSRLPRLVALHLGNNQLDSKHAEGLAASIIRHKLNRLENMTLGSNDIGDSGLAAVLKALPGTMRQLYLHGIDCTDNGISVLKDALDRWPNLWGLGLNGNPITDSGARSLARALRGRPGLRDVGITLSDMTDVGCQKLGAALKTCENLRYVYLYTSGFKAATKVTDEGKQKLKQLLPPHCTAAFDHRLSRYLKKP